MAVPRSFVDPSLGTRPSPAEAAGSERSDPDGPAESVDARWSTDPIAGMRPLPPHSLGERLHDWVDALRSPAAAGVRSRVPMSRWFGPAVAIALVGVGGWWFLKPPPAPVESGVPLAGASAGAVSGGESGGSAPDNAAMSASVANGATVSGAGSGAGPGAATTAPTELVVQASGAVVHPGVYRLPADARVDDLVRSAGGLGPEADGDRVNLAAPLVDGERIWIPRRGEVTTPIVVAGASGGGGGGGAAGARPDGAGTKGGGAASTPPAVVDLNSATATELEALPGVGPATATAILSYREEHGRFASVDDLLEVRGIGDAKLEQIRPLVRV
ncbi:MAG: ComEA family DNA-binding protein [Aquihabitans sp.]